MAEPQDHPALRRERDVTPGVPLPRLGDPWKAAPSSSTAILSSGIAPRGGRCRTAGPPGAAGPSSASRGRTAGGARPRSRARPGSPRPPVRRAPAVPPGPAAPDSGAARPTPPRAGPVRGGERAGAPLVRPLREDDDTGMGPQQPARGHPHADAVPVDHPSEVGGPGDAVRSERGDEVVGHDGQGAHRPPGRNPGRPRRQRAAGTWVAGASRGCSVAGPRTDQARRAV